MIFLLSVYRISFMPSTVKRKNIKVFLNIVVLVD